PLRAAPPMSLAHLLTTMPVSPVQAAADVVAAIAVDYSLDATVLVLRGEHWHLLAGDERLRDEFAPAGATDLDPRAPAVLAGDVAILLSCDPDILDTRTLGQACVWISMAEREARAIERAEAADDEAAVSRVVAEQIMSVRDLDQVLLT